MQLNLDNPIKRISATCLEHEQIKEMFLFNALAKKQLKKFTAASKQNKKCNLNVIILNNRMFVM